MLRLKEEIRSIFLGAMDAHQLDALIFPTFRHPPKRNGDSDGLIGSNNGWASECSFPAVSVPMGFNPAGLPCGLQFMGRRWDEHRLLATAERYERATHHRRPPF